jgi:hypothetical protein
VIAICVASVGMVIRGYYVSRRPVQKFGPSIYYTGPDSYIAIGFTMGRLGITRVTGFDHEYGKTDSKDFKATMYGVMVMGSLDDHSEKGLRNSETFYASSYLFRQIGFLNMQNMPGQLGSVRGVCVTIQLLLIVVPLVSLVTIRRQIHSLIKESRLRRDCCVKCGYSKESATSVRCPECGSVWGRIIAGGA